MQSINVQHHLYGQMLNDPPAPMIGALEKEATWSGKNHGLRTGRNKLPHKGKTMAFAPAEISYPKREE